MEFLIQSGVDMVTSETTKEIPEMRSISLADLTKFAQKCISAKVVIFLDCCYSGALDCRKGMGKLMPDCFERLSLEL